MRGAEAQADKQEQEHEQEQDKHAQDKHEQEFSPSGRQWRPSSSRGNGIVRKLYPYSALGFFLGGAEDGR